MKKRPLQIHIPKTAGASVRQALGVKDPEHLRGDQLRAHVGEDQWAAGFKFTFVRNPYDRLLIFYFWGCSTKRRVRRSTKRWSASRFVAKWPTFNEFATDMMRQALDGRTPAAALTQLYWIGGVDLDMVGRFEDMDRDWPLVCEHLGVPNIVLPEVHVTQHEPYPAYYDAEARELVRRVFQGDLDAFGYSF